MKHLLSCPCGQQLPIETAQAGEFLRCLCGQELEVPALRQIAALPLAPDQPTSPRSRWSIMQGIFFDFGIVITLLSLLVIGVCQWNSMHAHAERPAPIPEERLENYQQMLTPTSSLAEWREIKQEQLGRAGPPLYIQARQYREQLGRTIKIAGGIALLGIAMIALSMVLKPQEKQPAS